MRAAFIQTLIELAEADNRIALITGDMGFGVVEPFVERFPKRFVNAGVAEQNMTGIAAGMALSGKIVFTYSIGNFPTLRCLEQIRNDVCCHNANVKIVSVGAGLAYGALGASHHATEDIALMRAMPNMTVLSPADAIETRAATRAAVARTGPVYLRLARTDEPAVHAGAITFEIGKAIELTPGDDITLIAAGSMVHLSMQAELTLRRSGIHARVLSMHTIKPLDEEAVVSAASETAAIITVEEHSRIGGLGSAVAEVLAEKTNCRVAFRRVALPSEFVSLVGSHQFLRDAYSLSAQGIAQTALELCASAKRPKLTYAGDADFVLRGGDDI